MACLLSNRFSTSTNRLSGLDARLEGSVRAGWLIPQYNHHFRSFLKNRLSSEHAPTPFCGPLWTGFLLLEALKAEDTEYDKEKTKVREEGIYIPEGPRALQILSLGFKSTAFFVSAAFLYTFYSTIRPRSPSTFPRIPVLHPLSVATDIHNMFFFSWYIIYRYDWRLILKLDFGSGPRLTSVTQTHIARDPPHMTVLLYAYELQATIDVYRYNTRHANLPLLSGYK